MPSFLTNKKMNPALAARIEASVRGESRSGGARENAGRKRLLWSLARVVLVVLVILGVRSAVAFRSKAVSDLEDARAALTNDVRTKSSLLSDDEKNLVARARPWLAKASAGYEGDLVDESLRGDGLDKLLARPAVYVRGPIGAFGEEKTLAEAAAASRKDPLLVCLYAPPPSREEKVVLERVRAVYMGGGEARTPSARHLHEAMVGMPFLTSAWADKIVDAKDLRELSKLRHDFEKAPVDSAVKAGKATLLVFAMDEPGRGDGPVEIDGERVHDVRIGIVDLTTQKVLLRFKKTVDPGWITSTARVVYASGLDGCLFAMDVRSRVTTTTASR